MAKLGFFLLSLLTFIFPKHVYAKENPISLWRIFCAHQVKAQAPSLPGDAFSGVLFTEARWNALVEDLNSQSMPADFQLSEVNLDAWLRCESEYGERFEAAEFLLQGLRYFSVAAVSGQDPIPAAMTEARSAIYQTRWQDFLESLQKSVTLPKVRNTISMRAR